MPNCGTCTKPKIILPNDLPILIMPMAARIRYTNSRLIAIDSARCWADGDSFMFLYTEELLDDEKKNIVQQLIDTMPL